MRRNLSLLGLAAAVIAALALGLSSASRATSDALPAHQYVSPWRTPWTYDGKRGSDHWAGLDALYAACRGREQSPIDIRHPRRADLAPLRFEYRSSPIDYVTNNGATIRVNYGAGYTGGSAGSGDFLIVGAKRYQLTQFHFHRPSEERINGKAYDMVLHLMHQASDGEVAGVAVLLKLGRANATIEKLWAHMPKSEGDEAVAGLDIDPSAMLPRSLGYYAYRGSQTAPPCHEGVAWFVLKTPIEMSQAQVAEFAKLYPHDARPPQPLNGRTVQESRDD